MYGMVMGTVTVSIGATTGACVAFWLCRTLTKKWIEKHLSTNAKFNLFMLEVENNAWKITLITRLLPFPFGLVNGLFAVSLSSSLFKPDLNISPYHSSLRFLFPCF